MSSPNPSLLIFFVSMSVYFFSKDLKLEGVILFAFLISIFFGSSAFFGQQGDIILLVISSILFFVIQIIKYFHKNNSK